MPCDTLLLHTRIFGSGTIHCVATPYWLDCLSRIDGDCQLRAGWLRSAAKSCTCGISGLDRTRLVIYSNQVIFLQQHTYATDQRSVRCHGPFQGSTTVLAVACTAWK